MQSDNLALDHGWQESFKALFTSQVIIMLFLGFSAGLPILLIFSSLSLWLREAGVDRAAVAYFSWAALGYSFKFVWAPLVDRLSIPLLTKVFGQRRSWLLLAQLMILFAMTLMAFTNPAQADEELVFMAIGAVLLGFSSATQDIVIDAYRIELADVKIQGTMSASYTAGYRIGMIVAGAGALYLAEFLGSTQELYRYEAWKTTYHIMSLFVLVGIATTLLIHEPVLNKAKDPFQTHEYLRLVMVFILVLTAFIGCFVYSIDGATSLKQSLIQLMNNKVLASFLVESCRFLLAVFIAYLVAKLAIHFQLASRNLINFSYIAPVRNFFENYGTKTACLLLALIGLYRISDIVLGVISNVFYQDMGFTKTEIADAVKIFGLVMAIVGGFLGGVLSMRFGVMRMLFVGAVLVVLTNLLFIVLVHVGPNKQVLYGVVAADNLVAGLAASAFIAFMSSLVDVRFTAMQYAIFSSLMTLLPKIIGGYSGSMVDSLGYTQFFLIASFLGLPVLLLIYLANKSLNISRVEPS